MIPIAEPAHASTVERAIAAHELSRAAALTFDSETAMTADLLLTSSGTETLEAAVRRLPMIVTYRVSPVTYCIVRSLVRVGLRRSYTAGLPNLIAGRAIERVADSVLDMALRGAVPVRPATRPG